MDKRPYPEKGRERIQATLILERLNKHVLGQVEMSASQINAARILLAKVMPDLKAVEQHIEGEVNQKHSVDEQSAEQAMKNLYALLNAAREGNPTETA